MSKKMQVIRLIIYAQLFILSFWGRQIFPAEYLSIENIGVLYFPQSLFKLFHLPFPTETFYEVVLWSYRIGLLVCMSGFAAGAASLITAILGLYMLGFPYQFGFEPHYLSPHVILLFLMIFKEKINLEVCVKILWVAIFFNAGIEKLKTSGLEYFFSDKHLNSIILARAYFFDYNSFSPSLPFTRFMVETLKFHYFFGVGLLLELLAPLAFLKGRISYVIVIGMLIMQIMIFMMTELKHVWFYLPLYMVFIPDEKLDHFFFNRFPKLF